MRLVVHIVMGAVLSTATCAYARDVGFMPVDLEALAKRTDEVCRKQAPSLKPSYAEAHEAWKLRLGDYYLRYQAFLYQSAKKATATAQRYEELRVATEKTIQEHLESLAKNPELAKLKCREAIEGLTRTEYDAELKRTVDDFESTSQ